MSSMMLMFEKERRTSGARPESLLLQRISPCTLQLARRPLVSMTQSMESMMSTYMLEGGERASRKEGAGHEIERGAQLWGWRHWSALDLLLL